MKKLTALLLAGMLGILPVESALAEELSSGDETAVILDEAVVEDAVTPEETADPFAAAGPESVSENSTVEMLPQKDASVIEEIPDNTETASEDILSAGDAEEAVLESGEEIQAVGATYSGTWGTCKWDINEEGVLTIHAGVGADNQTPASEHVSNIYSVVAEKGVYFPQNSSHLFSDFRHCKSMDLSQADTSNVEDMSFMFYYCESLINLDLNNFNTSSVSDMTAMFDDCKSLTSLNLNSFDTSSVKSMGLMFSGCESLTSLNLSSFDTSKVMYMTQMFCGCKSLTSLNLYNFDTSNVTYTVSMFHGCESLTYLNLSSFDTSNVTEMWDMFFDCSSLIHLDLSNFDTSNVTDMRWMFSGCKSLTSLDVSNFDVSNVWGMWEMFNGCESLTSLDLSSFDTSNVMYMTKLFCGCKSLTSLDLSNFDTSSVKSMGYMFSGCESLTSLDLSNFDTSNVVYEEYNWKSPTPFFGMVDMFQQCENLSEIKVGPKFSFKCNGAPSAYLPNKIWQSLDTGKVFNSEEITETRNNITDTYYTVDFPQPRLIAAYNGAKGIGLKFHKVDNAKEYVLYRKFNGVWDLVCSFSAADPSLQIDGNKIMYTDTSIAKNYGKGYIYSVAAKNGNLETTYDTKGAAIYRLTPPALTATVNSSAGTATVTWKGVFGRTETNGAYDLQYAEYKDGKAGTFKSVTALPGYNNLTLSATVNGLKKGSRYVFRIRCSKTNKDRGTYYSEYSPWLSVTITK